MKSNKKDEVLLVTNPDNIFYLTGYQMHENTSGREAFLLISPSENLFITDGRLINHAREVLPKEFTVVERTHSGSTVQTVELFMKKHGFKKLGFEKENLTVAELERFTKELSNIQFIGTEKIIENLRVKKTTFEIEKIKKAAEITDKTFSALLTFIKPGLSELEIVWKIMEMFQYLGATPVFEPIVASSKGSAIPHYFSTNKKLKKGEIVLLDFGAKYEGYCSDMTRVVILGKADTKTQKIYNTVLTTQNLALNQLIKESRNRTTISVKEIDRMSRSYITKSGFPSIPHGLGHGVGISIHENPRLNPKSEDLLSPGTVFTIEPGIYLPGWGGIRIEDLLVWEKDGIKNIAKSSKKLIEL